MGKIIPLSFLAGWLNDVREKPFHRWPESTKLNNYKMHVDDTFHTQGLIQSSVNPILAISQRIHVCNIYIWLKSMVNVGKY